MSEKGWIKLHRKIKDSSIWKIPSQFDERSAWMDLLLMANHEKQTIILKNGQRLVLKPGQFHTSMQKLALRWRWSRGKVIRFFSMLTDEKMVTTKCTTHGTTVTIEKWGFYQDRRSTDDTTNSTRTRRIKNGSQYADATGPQEEKTQQELEAEGWDFE